MNNLTPLQEVASRIYAALITASTYTETDGQTVIPDYNSEKLLNQAISEAKALLEATKPEPLEWNSIASPHKGALNKYHYSNGGEFMVNECGNSEFYLHYSFIDKEALGLFPTLDEAKQFAEHIRTR